MVATRTLGVALFCVLLIGIGCDDEPTRPSEQFGPVRTLTLNVTPARLPSPGPVDIELHATTDSGMRVAPDAVRLVLVANGRETLNPAELDEDGAFTQKLYLSSSTIIRATAPGLIVERPITVDVPGGGVPQPVPPAPQPGPVPGPPRPGPALSVSLNAAPPVGTTATTFVFTAAATPLDGAGPAVSFDWDEDGDGTFELVARPNPHSVVFDTAGSKTVSVRANSSTAGISGTASAIVTVGPGVPFTVTLTATPECVVLGAAITFEATPENGTGEPLVYDWDFEGDGTFDPPPTAVDTIDHTYQTAGTRTARVRVTTTTDEEAVGERAVTVVPTFQSCPP
jgi:PKD domain